MRYLLDTNTCIAAMRNHPKVIQRMSSVSPGDCAISAVTGYELYTGVEKCAKGRRLIFAGRQHGLSRLAR